MKLYHEGEKKEPDYNLLFTFTATVDNSLIDFVRCNEVGVRKIFLLAKKNEGETNTYRQTLPQGLGGKGKRTSAKRNEKKIPTESSYSSTMSLRSVRDI